MAISSQEKKKFKNRLRLIKNQEEFKNFVYDLYVNHKYSYRNIVTIGRNVSDKINISMIIRILEEFDVKRCSKGADCKSPNGCIQSRKNFVKSKNSDGKNASCVYCFNFNWNFKHADQTKQNHMLEFHKIKEVIQQDKFLINLYKDRYSCNYLSAVSLRGINNIISILEKVDIKRCGRGKNCKNPNGYIQSRENFTINNNRNDKKNSICMSCQNFDNNFKHADQTKQNYILEFQKIKELDKQDKFLIEIYKNKEYTYQDLATISIRSIEGIISLLKKVDIKRCIQCGVVQSYSNFTKKSRSKDGLDSWCQTCQYEYNLENKENISNYGKIHYLKNKEKINKHHRNYNNQFGNYNTYASKLKFYEEVRRDVNNDQLIQVRCKTCKEWFNPTNQQLLARINAINGHYSIGTENHLYCSDTCKNSCPLYNQQVSQLIIHDKLNNNLTKEDFKRMQQELRSYFLKIRNPDRCELCNKQSDQEDLILHHITPVATDYIIETDDYNVVFVCQDCDKLAHQKDGCKTGQLAQFSIEDKLC